MESVQGILVPQVLTEEESSKIPEEIRKKLESYIQTREDEFVVSKAVFETGKSGYEIRIKKVEGEVIKLQKQNEEYKNSLDAATKEVEELKTKLSSCQDEANKLCETAQRLEKEMLEFRRQRDLAVDERDSLQNMVDRRNRELERMQGEIKNISNQLNAAINAKCEAIAQLEAVEAKELELDHREKSFEQERELLKRQIQSLSQELDKQVNKFTEFRREHTERQLTLETQLTQKTEELKIITETNENLKTQNADLVEKLENSLKKISLQVDNEVKIHENYRQELQAKNHLVEIYKDMSDEATSKARELEKAFKEIQQLLLDATEKYGELETEKKQQELSFEKQLTEKTECVANLKKELENANKLVKAAKQETLENAIESFSPTAAAASRFIKSGLTLTQMYHQYVTVSEELHQEKEENRKLKLYINTILEEIEAKAPILRKQQEEYQRAVEDIALLNQQLNESITEHNKLRQESADSIKSAAHLTRENKRQKQEIIDLSKQVCFLLKEVEEVRGRNVAKHSHMDIASGDVTSSSQVISQKLVTFSDIQELQSNNEKLLVLVRELSSKQEEKEAEKENMNFEQLKAELQSSKDAAVEYKEAFERVQKLSESLERQRNTYRMLYEQHVGGALGNEIMSQEMVSASATSKALQIASGNTSPLSQTEKEKFIKQLRNELEDSEKALKELKEEFQTYRIERQTNERMLTEELDNMRSQLRELRTQNAKLLSQAEYNEERFKILSTNTGVYKNQILALEEKNKSYSTTIAKHEQSMVHLRNTALEAESRLAKAEVTMDNLKEQYNIMKITEARLLQEKEVLMRERQSQDVLRANLELIKNSLERSEVEGKAKLESRLDDALRECGALRKRLQEEQDRFRELASHLELQVQNAKKRQEEEVNLAARAREELRAVKEELTKKKTEIEMLNKRLKEVSAPPPVQKTPTEAEILARKMNELEAKYAQVEAELKSTQQQLTAAKQHVKQYSEISECTEKQLIEATAKYEQYKEATEKKISEVKNSEEQLRKRVIELNTQLSKLSSGTNQSTVELNAQLAKSRDELRTALTELAQTKSDLDQAKSDLESLSGAVKAAEEKYSHEVVLHSEDIQALVAVKQKFAELESQVANIQLEKEKAEHNLKQGQLGWQTREEQLKKELDENREQIKNLDSQNSLLHDQIQAVGSQMAILQAQVPASKGAKSLSISSSSCSQNTSLIVEDVKASEQLLQIIRYLRREKDIATTKFDVVHAENLRLKTQVDYLEKQLKEANKALAAEQEKTDSTSITATKHSELMRKLDTLNAITDSNRILREERDALQVKERDLSEQVEKLMSELAPLKESHSDLNARVESMNAENTALRGEAARLRQRVNFLIERTSKASPEDWRRLQQERETLARQLTIERESHQKVQEEARILRQDKSRLEEQVALLQRQNTQHLEELKKRAEEIKSLTQTVNKLQEDLNETKTNLTKKNDELATITEDLGAKEALLTDVKNKEMQIRKIARRYKTQFEELTKTVEEERKAAKEKEEASAAATPVVPVVNIADIAPEAQETLREEGRREVEQRIREAETRHSDVVKELTEQVTSSHEEAESLRKENDSLKTSVADKEERAKQVLKSARQRIMQLTEAKNSLSKLVEQNRDEGAVQLNALKSQYDGRISQLEKENAELRSERQQEKDRMAREIESLNQRLTQLQRQLDKQQASKPSTSSGPVEKSTVEPPTANIKPMAGPSSTQTKQQPMQQSVAVTPWPGRGETPFASIRPMSLQSRTVAVLPTSQTSSSNSSQAPPSQSTQALVPPQQQLVHTTGSSTGTSTEGLSSSPTSSHTDYMPATSSAGSSLGPIRQVAVQPTQQSMVTTVTVGPSPSSREEPPLSAAESTQDMEAESHDMEVQALAGASSQQQQQTQQQQQQQQQQQMSQSQQGQQAVALVLPRVEQQSTSSQAAQEQQSVAVASSQANSSNTVTTTQAGLKRPRDVKSDSTSMSRTEEKSSGPTQPKRARGAQEMFQTVTSDSGVDVEYQVPTSSQRDHEDDGIVVDSDDEDEEEGMADEGGIEEPDDGQDFEEETDNGESYEVEGYDRDEQVLTPYDEVEGPDIDEENTPDQINNEVEIMEDSNEVPNQSGSTVAGTADNGMTQSAAASSVTVPVASSGEILHPPQQQHSEASSSGTVSQAESGTAISSVVTSQASPSGTSGYVRSRIIPPLSRQQQQLLLQPQGYEDAGDDSIVPSTPTLFVPRRTDGFGEAVSSPQVPQGRFTFSDTNSSSARAGIAQVASEGMDDTRMDLTQLEEGTGRSVPTTPLQVSPQGELSTAEMSGEVGQSVAVSGEQVLNETPAEGSSSSTVSAIPAITVTEAAEEAAIVETEEEMPPPQLIETEEQSDTRDSIEQNTEQEDILDLADEGGDGVSSEGEKTQSVEDLEEGREAEATEEPSTSPPRPRGGTARRSARTAFRSRGRGNGRPTPIIWNEPGSSMGSSSPRGRACMVRGGLNEGNQRGAFQRGALRGRRMRGKPKGNFPAMYQMRF